MRVKPALAIFFINRIVAKKPLPVSPYLSHSRLINSPLAPWVTAQNAPHRFHSTTDSPILSDRIMRVLTARWIKLARRVKPTRKPPVIRRERSLVDTDEELEELTHISVRAQHAAPLRPPSILRLPSWWARNAELFGIGDDSFSASRGLGPTNEGLFYFRRHLLNKMF